MSIQILAEQIDPRERTDQDSIKEPETLDTGATEAEEEEADLDDQELSEDDKPDYED